MTSTGSNLKTWTARKRLPVAKKPRFVEVGEESGRKIGLGYRRNAGRGTWVVRISDGHKGNTTQAVGSADDDVIADGATILTFYQARDIALALARNKARPQPGNMVNDGRPITESRRSIATPPASLRAVAASSTMSGRCASISPKHCPILQWLC